MEAESKVIERTRAWIEQAVIGLNLCPFAKAVVVKQQLRIVVTDAADEAALREALCRELELLAEANPLQLDTTLLVHPKVLADFDDYNQFIGEAEATVEALELDGVIQVATFHPHYRFAGTDDDDVTNATNRSPYPMLHLLREDSVERAVAAFPDAESIYDANMQTMETLGREGWDQLRADWQAD
jgi:uncharacterized protein